MIKEDIRAIRAAKRPPKLTTFWNKFGSVENGTWKWASESSMQMNISESDLARAAHIIRARGE